MKQFRIKFIPKIFENDFQIQKKIIQFTINVLEWQYLLSKKQYNKLLEVSYLLYDF